MNATRKKAEKLLYDSMDQFDKTGTNTTYYKAKFAKMSDAQFIKFLKRPFPIKFQVRLFEIEPGPKDILDGLKVLGVPLMERINLPYLYEDENGVPVQSKECQTGYLPQKKMKQFLTKKTGMSSDISSRDMRNGLLINHDKNGNTSDREIEAMAVTSLNYTMEELSGPRADAMDAKNQMHNTISVLGKVSLADLPKDPADSLSRNMLDMYLIGSLLKSNLITDDYHLRKSLEDQKGITREV